MRDFIVELLEHFGKAHGRPYTIGLMNTGGTLTALPVSEKNLELTPVQEKAELEQIIKLATDFGDYQKHNLLEIKFFYHNPVDSSQLLDPDREPWLVPLQQIYNSVDGVHIIHGTDTVSESARFLNLNLPYYDPERMFEGVFHNWTKPIVLISSQEPAAVRSRETLIPKSGSDADVSLATALALVSTDRVGEAGIIVNGYHMLRGNVTKKTSDSHIPPFESDKGVSSIAERTSSGLSLSDTGYLRKVDYEGHFVPNIIRDSAKFEKSILIVNEDGQLAMERSYLRAKAAGKEEIVEFMRDDLPKVILYGSKGAGNVQKDHHKVLKAMEEEGVLIMRVPLPGGRVPKKMYYDVPGGDIPGANIEQQTARYKAQSVLALMKQMGIKEEDQKEFFYEGMKFNFGNEFLPYK